MAETSDGAGRSPFDTSVPPVEVGSADATPVPVLNKSADRAESSKDTAADEAPAAAPRHRLPLLLAVSAVILIADVVSKQLVVAHLANRAPVDVIPSVLDLELTRNAGAAFGFAAGATVIFTVVAVAVVVFIGRAARKLASTGWAWSLGLLLGGALGNLGDRIFRAPSPLRGHVVDWIHIHHWPVFNLADSAIVVGGLLAVLLSMRGIRLDGHHEGTEHPAPGSDTA